MDLGDEEPLRVEPSETQGRESAAGLALSVILHGIALCLLLVVGVFGTEGSQGGLEIVPVEVEITNSERISRGRAADRRLTSTRRCLFVRRNGGWGGASGRAG